MWTACVRTARGAFSLYGRLRVQRHRVHVFKATGKKLNVTISLKWYSPGLSLCAVGGFSFGFTVVDMLVFVYCLLSVGIRYNVHHLSLQCQNANIC